MKKLHVLAMVAMFLIAGAMFAFDTGPPVDVTGLQQQAMFASMSQVTFASLAQAIVQRNLNSQSEINTNCSTFQTASARSGTQRSTFDVAQWSDWSATPAMYTSRFPQIAHVALASGNRSRVSFSDTARFLAAGTEEASYAVLGESQLHAVEEVQIVAMPSAFVRTAGADRTVITAEAQSALATARHEAVDVSNGTSLKNSTAEPGVSWLSATVPKRSAMQRRL
jgi:hypothetical protein